MLILGLDQSQSVAGAAILDGSRLLARRQWTESRDDRQQLVPALRCLLADAGCRPADIGVFSVGVGPGAYGGLRTSLAAACALALPGRNPVYALSSAEVMAWQVAGAGGVSFVRVVGDARRAQWWTRGFRTASDHMEPADDWRLVAPGDLPDLGPGLAASPDWMRIGAQLAPSAPPALRCWPEPVSPDAAVLVRLAAARMAAGIPSEPLRPIYLHPAVAARPG